MATETSAAVQMKDAFEFYRRGRVDEAERGCRAILKTAPEHFDATHLLGVIMLWRGDLATGEELLRHAIAIDPTSLDAQLHRAAALRYLKRSEEALALYGSLVQRKPDFGEAYYGRACVLIDLDRVADAVVDYEAAVRLLPDHGDLFNDYGIALTRVTRYEDAIQAFDRAITIFPNYERAFNNRGIALFQLRRFREAEDDFSKAISFKADYAEAYYNRGNALIAQQHISSEDVNGPLLEQALASFDRALAIGPGFAELFAGRGLALQLLGRYADGMANYEKAIALRADYPEAQAGYAACQAALGRAEALNIRL